MDYDSNGKHELIGECVTSLQAIVTGNGESKVELINPKKRAKKKDYRNSGRLVLTQCKVRFKHTFLLELKRFSCESQEAHEPVVML